MEQAYKISGMTCAGCAQIVHDLLSKVPGVKKVNVSLEDAKANIEIDAGVAKASLKEALANSLYSLSSEEKNDSFTTELTSSENDNAGNNEKLLTGYITATGKMDYETLTQYLTPDFEFNWAIHFNNAHDYLKMIKEHADSGMKNILVKNEIKAIFIDDDEACIIYDFVTNTLIERVPCFERILIKDNKISATEVKFDRQRMKLLVQEVRKHHNAN